jgi:hypothetical protein
MVKISRNIDITVKNKQVKTMREHRRESFRKFPPVNISGNFPSLVLNRGTDEFIKYKQTTLQQNLT